MKKIKIKALIIMLIIIMSLSIIYMHNINDSRKNNIIMDNCKSYNYTSSKFNIYSYRISIYIYQLYYGHENNLRINYDIHFINIDSHTVETVNRTLSGNNSLIKINLSITPGKYIEIVNVKFNEKLNYSVKSTISIIMGNPIIIEYPLYALITIFSMFVIISGVKLIKNKHYKF